MTSEAQRVFNAAYQRWRRGGRVGPRSARPSAGALTHAGAVVMRRVGEWEAARWWLDPIEAGGYSGRDVAPLFFVYPPAGNG